MTPQQQALVDTLSAALAADARVRSAWLSGSLGRGQGDPWSDVDITAVVEQADLAACVADFQAPRPDLPPSVFTHLVHGRVVSAITPAWDRFDLTFITPPEFAAQDGAALIRLLGDAFPPPARPPPTDAGAARRLTPLIDEFIRVLGLAPVSIHRGEWLVAQQGVELLRKMLVELMLEENGAGGVARGAKRLNAFLTPEQRAALEALPAPAASRAPLIAAQVELAQLFFARARPLALRSGVDWPFEFEAATRRHLKMALSLDI